MKILCGDSPVYKINLYNRRFVIVETCWTNSLVELCDVVASLEKDGNIVTSVVRLTEGRSTPRVKIKGTKEWRQAVKRINLFSEEAAQK